MNTVIAIFLLLKAVSNAIKLPQGDGKSKSKFMAHVFIQLTLLATHLWFGLWMLLNP